MNKTLGSPPREDRLKAFCVGSGFSLFPALPDAAGFPAALLSQTEDFTFDIEPALPLAFDRLQGNVKIDLLLIDVDGLPSDAVRHFVRDARRLRPALPIIVFSNRADDRMRYLMLEGANWHFTKRSRRWHQLADSLRHYLPSMPMNGNSHEDGAEDNRPLANPYVVGRPLTRATESLFVGRKEVFAWLADNLLDTARPNTLMLLGRRRIGKTSTLYQLVEGRLGKTLRQNRDQPICPIYIDLQRYAGRSTDEWLRSVARDIYRKTNGVWYESIISEDFFAGNSPYSIFDECLDHLEKNLPQGGIILLAVDELGQIRDGIESGNLNPDLMAYLRSQFQHRDRIAFLLCGARDLTEPFWQPIFNLAIIYELGLLAYEDAAALIRRPLTNAISFEEAAVDSIWQHTSGHPYLVQAICHRLVTFANRDNRRRPVSLADVEIVTNQLFNEGFSAGLDLGDSQTSRWQSS